MPLISAITPTHSFDYFVSAHASMLNQSLSDWEWVVVVNGEALKQLPAFRRQIDSDPRIKLVQFDGAKNEDDSFNVGALKKAACDAVSTPYAVEFDHDDDLATNCLEKVHDAFIQTGAVFVFSNAVRESPEGQPHTFNHAFGWEYQPQSFYGTTQTRNLVPKHPLLLPQNITRIWFAPDHVRAWDMAAYRKVGGHDPSLKVCDDLDLMCKLYAISEGGRKFHHIDAVLYRYVVHGNNTWLKNQQLIEQLMWGIHDRNIEEFARVYWQLNGRRAIDIGGGIDCPKGWESVDVHSAEITADLNDRWPFEDNSVGAVRAHDILEHLDSHIHVMNEAYRVLDHGGLFLIEVPSTDGRGAFQDPSHVSFWNSNSFWYYTREQTQRYIKHLGINCRFQLVRIANYFPSDWHKLHNIVYTKCHLAAIKDGPRLHGAYDV